MDPPEDEFDGPAVFWFREIEVTEGSMCAVYMGHVLEDGQFEQKVVADQFHAESGMTEFSVRGVRMGACDEERSEKDHGCRAPFLDFSFVCQRGAAVPKNKLRGRWIPILRRIPHLHPC